jgi:signal transduction histidine kinase/CheY-like chemotaxis protein
MQKIEQKIHPPTPDHFKSPPGAAATVAAAAAGANLPLMFCTQPNVDVHPGSIEAALLALSESEARHRFLSQATQLLNSSLDVDELFPRFARIAVPLLGELCVFDLLQEDGTVRRVAWAHSDPRLSQKLGEVLDMVPNLVSDVVHPVSICLRTGRAVMNSGGDEMRQRISRSDEHLQVLRELDVGSVLSVPLVSAGQVLGAMTYSKGSDAAPHTQNDLLLAEEVAERATIAVVNSRLYTAEQKARADAESANKAKDRFFATLSHELRTPLSPALMILSGMAADEKLPQAVRDDARLVRRNIEHQTRLIDDLLDLSRIEHNKLVLHNHVLDLHALLVDSLASCRHEAQPKKIHIAPQLHSPSHLVVGDSDRLRQAFCNLLRNAVKFTPANGTITLRSMNPTPGRIAVDIIDSGIGIEPHMLATIFNAFEQGGQAITNEYSGLGLGLAIAKGVIDAHGGSIRVASDGRGKGAAFTIELNTSSQPLNTGIPADHSPRAPRTEPLKILLVDDHHDTLAVMSRLLRRLGYHVTTASSIQVALAAGDTETFDLLISDVGLPDGSGLDLMQQLRARHHSREIRGIAVTGYGTETDVQNARNAGFAAHLTKPVQFNKLEALILELAN